MSAESKKKRGESGRENAQHIPFRYGGSRCNVSTAIGRAERIDKARYLSALALGAVIQRLYGYEMRLTNRMYNWADEALDHCTVDRPS